MLISLDKTRIPITLKLMDSDTFPDSDDIADINPLPGQDVLTLNYEPGTGSTYSSERPQLPSCRDKLPAEVEVLGVEAIPKRWQNFACLDADYPCS